MIDGVSQWILSLLIIFPILVAFVVLILPTTANYSIHRKVALAGIIIEFLLSLHLIKHFVPSSAQIQFAQVLNWLPEKTGIKYIVGVDGLNLILVLLSTAFSLIAMLTVYHTIKTHVKAFLALFLLLESSIIGVFVSLDIVLFYVFWELSLIPVYFMIGIWGGKNRVYATIKLFVYGVIGRLLLLFSFVYP